MQKTLFISFFFFFSVSYAQTWLQIADFPSTERDDACVFVIGNKAYCGTGYLPWFVSTNDFYCLDLNTELWSTINAMPALTERQYACAFSYNQYGYVFGGINGTTFLNDLYRYDTTSGIWTAMTSLPDTGRSGSSCFVLNDTAYIIGGKNSAVIATNEVWAYAILTDTWIQKNNLPNNGRFKASAVENLGNGYLIFGRDKTGNYCKELYKYNQLTDTWTTLWIFPGNGRNYTALTAQNGSLFFGAGIDVFNNYYSNFYQYKTASSTWNTFASIPSSGRKGGISFSSSNSIYYSTGVTSTNTQQKETWRFYDPTIINESNNTNNIMVYPNPSNGNFQINTDLNQFNVKILAIDGQMVYSSTNESNNCTINAANLARGFYYLYLSDGLKNYTQKIIIK